ncbi:hypothetical protein F9L33_11650 [Amylibacter sp. SFDW26]|uniref:hypothetical protein n=1 Tax=Amylibacter sp. SFDW26 TaxID=2652722 RepID=UPI0012623F30|nr:hypothetical protein [Amylibacter sp. SFDW26]KAB7613255.1 hypothetical protein F9L33_11650 [Amylibacter sp. SFDW26]
MIRKLLLSACIACLGAVPGIADTKNDQKISLQLRFSKSDSNTTNRDRERISTILRYTKKFAPKASGFFYLYNANLDATNAFGTSDADINGIGAGMTFNVSKLTIATLAFSYNDNAEVFNGGGAPATSDGDAVTIVAGLQRLFGIGRKSTLVGSINHAVSVLDQDFTGTPFEDTRHITTLGLQYTQKIAEKTSLSVGAKSLFSNENITAHLVDQANYVSVGLSQRFGAVTTVSLTGSSGIGAISGDSSIGLKVSRSF